MEDLTDRLFSFILSGLKGIPHQWEKAGTLLEIQVMYIQVHGSSSMAFSFFKGNEIKCFNKCFFLSPTNL